MFSTRFNVNKSVHSTMRPALSAQSHNHGSKTDCGRNDHTVPTTPSKKPNPMRITSSNHSLQLKSCPNSLRWHKHGNITDIANEKKEPSTPITLSNPGK